MANLNIKAVSDCPGRSRLSAFLEGNVTCETWDQIFGHLETCAECQAMLPTIDIAPDPFVGTLRSLATRTFSCETEEFLSDSALDLLVSKVALECGAPTVAETAGTALGKIDRYELLAEIKRGGMGVLYKGLDPILGRLVAIKVLQAGQSVSRFQREAWTSGTLPRNDHFVMATDYREHDGRHCLVMQFVEGEDFSTLVKRNGPLSIADACEVGRQTLFALQYAFEHGLVHRDIKPGNLMLTHTGTVKVLDWGLALPSESEELTQGGMLGTRGYVSPEQEENAHEVDIRTDIYSLGCTLFSLLTGGITYGSPKALHGKSKSSDHAAAPNSSIATWRPDIPPALGAIIHRMLEHDPARRYQTPVEAIEEIAPFAQRAALTRLLNSGDECPDEGGAAIPLPSTSSDVKLPLPGRTSALPVMRHPSLHGWRVALLAVGVVLLMGMIFLVIRDRNGNERARIAMKTGDTLSIEPGPGSGANADSEPAKAVASRPRVLNDRQFAEWMILEKGRSVGLHFRSDPIDDVAKLPKEFMVQTAQLSKAHLQDADADKFSALSNLQGLNLSHNGDLTDGGIAKILSHSPQLVWLFLVESRLTDKGLEAIGKLNLKHLTFIDLRGTEITDEGLKSLAGVPWLENLWLSETQISDTGLANLQALTKLTELHLKGTNVTSDGVEAFRRDHPNCKVLMED